MGPGMGSNLVSLLEDVFDTCDIVLLVDTFVFCRVI